MRAKVRHYQWNRPGKPVRNNVGEGVDEGATGGSGLDIQKMGKYRGCDDYNMCSIHPSSWRRRHTGGRWVSASAIERLGRRSYITR